MLIDCNSLHVSISHFLLCEHCSYSTLSVMQYSTSRGVFGTPFFFVNGFVLPDAGSPLDYNGWRSIIDPLVGAKSSQSINVPHFIWRAWLERPQALRYMFVCVEERINTVLYSVEFLYLCACLPVTVNGIAIKVLYFCLAVSNKARASSKHICRFLLSRQFFVLSF